MPYRSHSFQRAYHIFVGSIAVLYLALVLLFVIGYVSNRNRVQEIQQNRVELCQDQNMRHDQAVIRVHNSGLSPEGRQVTLSILDAIIPVRDCKNALNK